MAGQRPIKSVFGSVVAGAFQIAFRAEMHANDVFLFFKNHFWHQHIKTIQKIQTALNFSKKKKKKFKFGGNAGTNAVPNVPKIVHVKWQRSRSSFVLHPPCYAKISLIGGIKWTKGFPNSNIISFKIQFYTFKSIWRERLFCIVFYSVFKYILKICFAWKKY